jgi:hypothetical protein
MCEHGRVVCREVQQRRASWCRECENSELLCAPKCRLTPGGGGARVRSHVTDARFRDNGANAHDRTIPARVRGPQLDGRICGGFGIESDRCGWIECTRAASAQRNSVGETGD